MACKKISLRRNLHGNCRSTTVNLSPPRFFFGLSSSFWRRKKNVRFEKIQGGPDWISIYRCVCRVDSHTHTCSAAPYRWHTWRRTRYAFLMVAASRQMLFIVRNDPDSFNTFDFSIISTNESSATKFTISIWNNLIVSIRISIKRKKIWWKENRFNFPHSTHQGK